MEGVSDPELIERARNAGIITDYSDWRGQHVEVPAETLAAILAVLDQSPAVDEQWTAEDEAGLGELRPASQLGAS